MRSLRKATVRDEAEKPFWISYADLMTALMVLFLVVMSVALLAVTKKVTQQEQEKEQHLQDIETLLDRFEAITRKAEFKGISIDRTRRVVDFGSRAQFPFARSSLNADQEKLLRAFVPEVLALTNDDLGRKVLDKIVVDGFTDRTGTYLQNLDLSLQRSQRVLCALFGTPGVEEKPMTAEQLEMIRAFFVVGGYSFNAAKETDEQSRRIEMRLQILDTGKPRETSTDIPPGNFGRCALGSA